MTRHSRIWAIGTLAIFLPLGAIVMLGFIPGRASDLEFVEDFVIITKFLVGEHGAIMTGFFYMLIGVFLASVFLVWGDTLRRAEGDGSGAIGDCGDGGD